MRAATRTAGVPLPPPWGHDGTERPIHRPIDPEAPQDYYRGQKTWHTITNRLVIDETGHLCVLSDTVEGQAQDQSLADRAGDTLPRGSHLDQEMGCQGVMLDGITIIQPTKKPREGELTPPEKAHHRMISSISIRLAHAIGGVTREWMVKDTRRLLKDRMRDTIMEPCGGLHHFRLQDRPWNYAT